MQALGSDGSSCGQRQAAPRRWSFCYSMLQDTTTRSIALYAARHKLYVQDSTTGLARLPN